MKLVRYGAPGAEKPALLSADGKLRDLSGVIADIDANLLSDEGLAQLAGIDASRLPVVEGKPRLGVPWTGITKFVCIGLNYSDHAAESGLPVPSEPIIFLKANSAISGPDDPILQPRHSTKLDWEVELGVVIGKRAQYVEPEDALSHVAGYCVVNDVSERAFQMQSAQWDKGKGCDSFGPIGPWLVTRDEIPDPQALDMWLEVNGRRMQTGSTATMIFDVKTLVSYTSRYMTLEPGDIIATGTPPGVGMGIKPAPVFLQQGDVVELGISHLGQQRQVVAAPRVVKPIK